MNEQTDWLTDNDDFWNNLENPLYDLTIKLKFSDKKNSTTNNDDDDDDNKQIKKNRTRIKGLNSPNFFPPLYLSYRLLIIFNLFFCHLLSFHQTKKKKKIRDPDYFVLLFYCVRHQFKNRFPHNRLMYCRFFSHIFFYLITQTHTQRDI